MNAPIRRLLHWRAIWPTLLVLLCCLVALFGVAQLERGQAQAQAEAQVRETLSGLRSQIDAVTEATFSATATLEVLLRVQGRLDLDAVRMSLDAMLRDQTQLRNVAVAPSDVVSLVHPMATNQRALGLDYRSVPAQWAQVERARQLRTPLIFAPVKLVQGGMGVIQRRPVFLPGPQGEPRYWGVISTVADLERFLTRAGVTQSPLELALVERHADGRLGHLIWGDADLLKTTALREDLKLPGATWTLLGRPRGGWPAVSWLTPWFTGGALMSLALVVLSGLLGLRRVQLAQQKQSLEFEIEARRASQREADESRSRLQSLLATASDWYWEQDADLRLTHVSGSHEGTGWVQLGKRRWEQSNLVPGQPDDNGWREHRRTLEARLPFRDFRYAIRDGQQVPRWLSISGDPIFDERGHFCGYRGTTRDISTMRDLNRALADTRERLQAVMAAATQVAIIVTDLDDHITDFNSGAERLLDYPATVVLGSSPHRFVDPKELQERAAQLGERLGRKVGVGEVFRLTMGEAQSWTLLRRNGSKVRVSLVVNELRDSAGQLRGHLGLAIDLSTELAAKTAQRATAARLQAVMDSAEGVAIITCRLDGTIELFNRGAEIMLGCAASDAVGQPAVRFHLREELEAEAAALSERLGQTLRWTDVFIRQAQGLDGGHTRLWTYVRADDGSHRRVAHTFSELHDVDGRVVGYLGIARDVTSQVEAERALRDTHDRLQAVLDAALDVGILAIDMAGCITLFNKGAERLFGYRSDEILGKSTLLLHDPDELRARADAMSAELGRPVHRHEVFMLPLETSAGSTFSHWTYVRKDGSRIAGALRLSRLLDHEGKARGLLAIAIDISAEQRARTELEALNHELESRVSERGRALAMAQDELLRSERLAALGSLVAGVAHELNTPLGTCMTAASTLHDRTRELRRDVEGGQLRRSTLDAYMRDTGTMTELLLRGLRNASDLVQHFKQLSVDQTGDQRRGFQLEAVVADVLTVLRPQLKGGALHIELDLDYTPTIDAYPGELGRLLTNLILNAQLHAFEAGAEGHIRISARPLPGDRFEFVVADDGRGMSEDVRRRAFDPFFTTKLGQGGSGLGLNIVWNIATTVLGGSVRLESSPGQGARFIFELPRVAPQRNSEADDMKMDLRAPGASAAEHMQPRRRSV